MKIKMKKIKKNPNLEHSFIQSFQRKQNTRDINKQILSTSYLIFNHSKQYYNVDESNFY